MDPGNAQPCQTNHFGRGRRMTSRDNCGNFTVDVKQTELSSSNEDIITALEALNNGGKSRRSPRPTSVPFNKSLLSDTTAKV